jgi:hypothetical protein
MDPHRARVLLNQLNTWLQGPRLKDLAGLHSEFRHGFPPDNLDYRNVGTSKAPQGLRFQGLEIFIFVQEG